MRTTDKPWTGDWDAPKVPERGPLRIGQYVLHITAKGYASFEGVHGADGEILARDRRFLVIATKPSTVFSGQGQPRIYHPAEHHLYMVEGVIESQDFLDVVLAIRLMGWSPISRGDGRRR